MTEIHEKLLNMLKWFHNFCLENEITYYALGGTALGAVRHKGFIPWDDDIDVGIPRHDYERFIGLAMKESRKGKYMIEYPLKNKDSIYAFTKIYDTDTLLIENASLKTKRGIYIDVFPLDGIGNTIDEAYKNYDIENRFIKMWRLRVSPPKKGHEICKYIAHFIIGLTPQFIFGRKYLIKKVNETAKKIDYNKSAYVANLFGVWGKKEITKKSCFGTPNLVKFEDTQIFIAEDADLYLKTMYGDYMKLPPVEERVAKHDCFIDLHKSYLEE